LQLLEKLPLVLLATNTQPEPHLIVYVIEVMKSLVNDEYNRMICANSIKDFSQALDFKLLYQPFY